jgi:CxxC-x17-CxxC domain-containing protein
VANKIEVRFPIKCSRCGDSDSVPLKPSPGRDVFCRKWLVKLREAVRYTAPTSNSSTSPEKLHARNYAKQTHSLAELRAPNPVRN